MLDFAVVELVDDAIVVVFSHSVGEDHLMSEI